MANRAHTTNPSRRLDGERLSSLFRDPVLRRIFAASERDDGANMVEIDRAPKPRLDADAVRVLEFA